MAGRTHSGHLGSLIRQQRRSPGIGCRCVGEVVRSLLVVAVVSPYRLVVTEGTRT